MAAREKDLKSLKASVLRMRASCALTTLKRDKIPSEAGGPKEKRLLRVKRDIADANKR